MQKNKKCLILKIYILYLISLSNCIYKSSFDLGFIPPEPGFINIDKNNFSVFDFYDLKNESNIKIQDSRNLQSSNFRNLKVHVDYSNISTLSVDKRVYIQSNIQNNFNFKLFLFLKLLKDYHQK